MDISIIDLKGKKGFKSRMISPKTDQHTVIQTIGKFYKSLAK